MNNSACVYQPAKMFMVIHSRDIYRIIEAQGPLRSLSSNPPAKAIEEYRSDVSGLVTSFLQYVCYHEHFQRLWSSAFSVNWCSHSFDPCRDVSDHVDPNGSDWFLCNIIPVITVDAHGDMHRKLFSIFIKTYYLDQLMIRHLDLYLMIDFAINTSKSNSLKNKLADNMVVNSISERHCN